MINILYIFTLKLKKHLPTLILTNTLILIVFDYCIYNIVELYSIVKEVKNDNVHSEMYTLSFINSEGKMADANDILNMNTNNGVDIYNLLNNRKDTSTMISYFSYQNGKVVGIIDANYYKILDDDNLVTINNVGEINCDKIYIEVSLVNCNDFENSDFFPEGTPMFKVNKDYTFDDLEITNMMAFMLISTSNTQDIEEAINKYLESNNIELTVQLVSIYQESSEIFENEINQKEYILKSLVFPIVLVLIGMITLVIKIVNILRQELSVLYLQGYSKQYLYFSVILYLMILWILASIFNIVIGKYSLSYAYIYALIQFASLFIGSVLGYFYTNFNDIVTITKEVD